MNAASRITEYYFEFAVSNIVNILGLVCKNEVHTVHGRILLFLRESIYLYC